MSLEDRFDIGAPIHIGQIATAYPARQKDPDRQVLLKIIHPQFATDSELLERFEREGQAMARIDHPNVVKVYEQASEENLPYLVLEWVEGGTLSDKIKDGPLDQARIKKLAGDILTGLEAVHKNGLIHRDLKPDNIMICQNGSAKLSDFSLSGFDSPSGLTEHGAMIGTPAYFAPELTGGAPANEASDLYSVGMILFEALTGSNPFSNADPIVTLGMIHKTKLPSLKARSGIDHDLAEMVDSLLNHDLDKRPVTARVALNLLSGIRTMSGTMAITKRRLTTADRVRWGVFIGLAAIIIAGLILVEDDEGKWAPAQPVRIEYKPPTVLTVTLDSEERIQVIEASVLSPLKSGAPVNITAQLEELVREELLPAYLTIIVRPWANIFQDNEKLGISPLGRRNIAVGVHKFRFINRDFPSIERTVDIKSGSIDTLWIDFRAESCGLEIVAEPWGYLWVDSDSIGLLPRAEPVWLKGGDHVLKISHPVFGVWLDTISVENGTQHNYKVNLAKQILETTL